MNEVFALILQAQASLSTIAEAAVLTFLRVGAAMATLPAFGEQTVPTRIRLVLTLMFTAAILPATAAGLEGISLAQGFLPEVAVGLTIGLSLRMFILALITAGTIAANATSLSQLFPSGAEPQPAIAQLLTVAGLALALQADLHLRIVSLLILSYDLLPGGRWPDSAAMGQWGTERAGHAFSLAFMISMPFLIASLLYNVALGVINRAMPQLMVSFVGAPALSLGGLVLLALVAPLGLAVWLQALNGFAALPGLAP